MPIIPYTVNTLKYCVALALTAFVCLAAPHADARIARTGYQPLEAHFWSELVEANTQGEAVVVVFTADWCTPCKALKTLIDESAPVQRVLKTTRILYIDVDEWRGPAHRLIAGAVPRRLPMIAAVDQRGGLKQVAMGTEMGLLSAEAVADNFSNLLAGRPATRAAYLDDAEEKTRLMREHARRQAAAREGKETLTVSRPARGARDFVNITIHNLDSRRRWFAIPEALGTSPPATLKATRRRLKFKEHVRANMYEFQGEQRVFVIPVAGDGFVTLNGWPLQGGPGKLTVAELSRLKVDGHVAQFEKKVPYALTLREASQWVELNAVDTPALIELSLSRFFQAEVP